jgi:beta-glucosidase
MDSGTAIAAALFGDVNPSGRLTVSWPRNAADSPAHALGTQDKENVNYTEGILVGYRYFDTKQVAPQFPFGYGLSYTDFAYKNLSAGKAGDAVRVTLDVTNTGGRDGAETVQLYVAAPKAPVERPVHELKAFEKVFLKAGETRRVTLTLGREAFAYYDVKTAAWVVVPGEYTLEAAHSSREIRLKTTIGM